MSIGQLGSIKMLDFDGMPKMSVTEGRRLGGCLALCGRLEKLDLRAGIMMRLARPSLRAWAGCSHTCR